MRFKLVQSLNKLTRSPKRIALLAVLMGICAIGAVAPVPDIIVKGGTWYDVRLHTTLSAALTAIGSSQKTVLVVSSQAVSADLTVGDNIDLWVLGGGGFVVASGKTLNLSDCVVSSWGTRTIFTGAGTLVPPRNPVKLEWFTNAAAAITMLGTNPVHYTVEKNHALIADTTFPSTATVEVQGGGSFSVTTGNTLTVSGPFVAPQGRQVFYGDGEVLVSSFQPLYANWWASFAKAVTGIGTNSRKLVVNSAKVISANLTVPTSGSALELVVESGGQLQPATATTTTLGVCPKAGVYQVIGGAGVVNFPSGCTVESEWFSTPQLAVTAIGAVVTTLRFNKAVTLAAGLTIPATCSVDFARGAIISPATYALSIQGPILAGPWQIFASDKRVTIGDTGVSMIRPEHWGAGQGGNDTGMLNNFCYSASAGVSLAGVNRAIQANTIRFTPGAHYYLYDGVDCQSWPGLTYDARGAKFTFKHNKGGFDLNPFLTGGARASQAYVPMGGEPYPRTTESDNATVRNVQWLGGYFNNDNATKTASWALRAYYMRGFRLDGARFGDDVGGFETAVWIGGKDTYDISNNFFTLNKNSVRVPPTGTIYVMPGYGGNRLLDTRVQKNHFSMGASETGIKVADAVMNFSILDNTFAGAPTIAQVHFLEGTASASNVTVGVQIQNNKFEQMGQNATTDAPYPAVFFDDSASGYDFYSVDFNGNFFNSGVQRAGYVALEVVHGAHFGTNYFWPGTGSIHPKYGIYVTSTCDDVQIDRSTTFTNFMYEWDVTGAANNGSGAIRLTLNATDHYLYSGDRIYVWNVTGTTEANGMWVVTRVNATHVDLVGSTFTNVYAGGGTIKHMNAIVLGSDSARPKITVLPEIVTLGTSVHLNDWSNTPVSGPLTNSEIRMDNQFDFFVSTGSPAVTRYLWPKGYFLTMAANDSNSSIKSSYISLHRGGDVSYGRIYLGLSGVANSATRAVSGLTRANDNGTILVSATEGGGMNATIGVMGFQQ
jgi:hypothetical protein